MSSLLPSRDGKPDGSSKFYLQSSLSRFHPSPGHKRDSSEFRAAKLSSQEKNSNMKQPHEHGSNSEHSEVSRNTAAQKAVAARSAYEHSIRPGIILVSAGPDTKETTIKWTEVSKIIHRKRARPGMKTSGLGLNHEPHEQDSPLLPLGSRAKECRAARR